MSFLILPQSNKCVMKRGNTFKSNDARTSLDIELKHAEKVVAGFPAVVQSFKHIMDEMPLSRGSKP